MSAIPLMGIRPRTRHAISIIRVIPTAKRNSSVTPSGLSRYGIFRKARNSPTTMGTRSMTRLQIPAIAARIIVVVISLVSSSGTASRRQRLGHLSACRLEDNPYGDHARPLPRHGLVRALDAHESG